MRLYFWLDRKILNKRRGHADRSRSVLSAQQISPDGPGTILKDAGMLIDFVRSEKVVSKGKNGSFPMEMLPELNRRSSCPIDLELKRALLRDYPNLSGLFVLLRVRDLFQTQGRRLIVNAAALDLWEALNPTERYFALLEALLFESQSSVLGGQEHRDEPEMIGPIVAFLVDLNPGGKWRNFDRYIAATRFR